MQPIVTHPCTMGLVVFLISLSDQTTDNVFAPYNQCNLAAKLISAEIA